MALKRTGFSEESKRKSREKALKKQREQGRKPIKRTAPKQRGRRNGRPHTIIEQAEIDAMRRFHNAARVQGVCGKCGDSDSWDAHHVVEKSWLKANGRSKVEQYDPDNALRLCDENSRNRCHPKQTKPVKDNDRVHLRQLKRCNLEYAFREMGAAAGPYLRRKYRGEDERLDRLEKEYEQQR